MPHYRAGHSSCGSGRWSRLGVRQTSPAHYHENVTGQKPDWPCQQRALSSSKKKMVHPRGSNLWNFLTGLREATKHFFEKPTLPLGSGSASDRQEHHLKQVISVQETESILKLCTEKRISLVDISVAGINLAIDEWNEARNVTPGILTTSISVNMKGRFQGFEKANNSALMVFKSGPDERRDPNAFVWGTALKRRKYFDKPYGFKVFSECLRDDFHVTDLPVRSEAKDCQFLDEPSPVLSYGNASRNHMASRGL